MTAARKDFNVDQGGTFDRTVTYRTPAGALVNLTGYTAKMEVRPAYGSTDVLLSLTTENGGVTLGGALGTIRVLAIKVQTGALVVPLSVEVPPRLFAVYDLWIYAADGTSKRLLQGRFIVSRQVST